MENTINKNIEELLKNKNLGTEKYVEAIKDILTSNGEEILLTDEQIQAIIDGKDIDVLDSVKNEQQYDSIHIIANCLKNLKREKMKDFIKRKNEYLEKNRTISKEKFEELFGGSGKYGKAEINQGGLGLCRAYTGFELLKKMNGFDEIIQTHLKKAPEGWEIRLPFFDEKGEWIKVNNNEIDKKFHLADGNIININSHTKSIGFKILEIAFMKAFIIGRCKSFCEMGLGLLDDYKKERKEFSTTGDINLTYSVVSKLSNNNLINFMFTMFNDDYIFYQEKMSDADGIEEGIKDLAFDYYRTGLYVIELSHANPKTLNDVKIICKHPGQPNEGLLPDIIIDKNGNKSVNIYPSHAYSIEKCYIDKNTGEKRVRVVNPRHTGIKYDISLEDCKSIFKRNVVGIDIDKMFR